jgi:hypothetical protein
MQATTQAMSLDLQEEVVPSADETRTKLPGFLRSHVVDWVQYEGGAGGGQGQRSELIAAQERQVYEVPSEYTEVLLEVGDLLILDPMLMHSASANAGELHSSRHVLGTTFFAGTHGPTPCRPAVAIPTRCHGCYLAADTAIGTTLAALPDRYAVGPATKFSPELQRGLKARGLQSLLDWELPLQQSRL